jgi:predicted kinase
MSNKLYIFCGIPFSGKTTLAKELEKTLGYKRIDLDEVKFSFFGNEIRDANINQEGWDKIYQEMYKQIEESLKNGETVIHDTGNFTKHERELVKEIADKLGIEAITVFLDIPKRVRSKGG